MTDGIRYHKMRLRDRVLYIRSDMQPRQAFYNMLQVLEKAHLKFHVQLEKRKAQHKLSIKPGTLAAPLLPIDDAQQAQRKRWAHRVAFAHSSLLGIVLLWLSLFNLSHQACSQASKDPLFRLDEHSNDPRVDQQAVASLRRLGQLQTS